MSGYHFNDQPPVARSSILWEEARNYVKIII